MSSQNSAILLIAYLIGTSFSIFLTVIFILMWLNTNKLVDNTNKLVNKK